MGFWIAAENITGVHTFAWEGGEFTGTLTELLAEHADRFRIEYKDNPSCHPNLVSDYTFTVDGQTANEIIGGVHSPQRPK